MERVIFWDLQAEKTVDDDDDDGNLDDDDNDDDDDDDDDDGDGGDDDDDDEDDDISWLLMPGLTVWPKQAVPYWSPLVVSFNKYEQAALLVFNTATAWFTSI